MLNNVGQYHELPSWWKQIKCEWKKAAKTPISIPLNEKYRPSATKWVCTCPQFHKSRFMLCKHLVQLVHPVHPVFFLEVKRQQTTPFWVHRSLVPLDAEMPRETELCHGDQARNESGGENESDSEDEGPVDTGEDIGICATFQEQFTHYIEVFRKFCNGLEYQVQFNDRRMLDTVEREGAAFICLAQNCLDHEQRQNSTRMAAPMTWE